MRNGLLLPTPIGAALHVETEDERIVRCEFGPMRAASAARVRDPLLREAKAQLQAYFRKRLRAFDLPMALHGTPLQIAIWEFVAHLETGELISYGDVARAIGKARGHRIVAMTMARSPYDLIIPAHRVIGADFKVKGAGDNAIRRRLLAFEGIAIT
jgi:methylated-DNA-[protein]-cysteine S-methyltransferase